MPARNCAAFCPSGSRSPNLRLSNSSALVVAAALAAAPAWAHDPITTKLTWTQEVSRLVYRHCTGCHREGGRAFSLTTYPDARPWAKAIRDEVLARRMPPWGPVKGVGHFADDPSLSLPELEMFVQWVEGGAPEGDPALLPGKVPPPSVAPEPLRNTREIALAGPRTLDRLTTILALRPTNLPDHQSLEAWALKPDGTREPLIWLRDYRPAFARDYRLAQPLRLPKGTKLELRAPAGAGLTLLSKPSH
jgi:hypothetical protein